MASGYISIHPDMAAALQECGLTTDDVIQGYGNAAASAGYHDPEGRAACYPAGHRFSSCVDLPYDQASNALVDHLTAAGFCVFVRQDGNGWNGASHMHCVYVGAEGWPAQSIPQDRSQWPQATILAGPRMQIVDFIHGRNGLVGHAPIAVYVPSADQRAFIQDR